MRARIETLCMYSVHLREVPTPWAPAYLTLGACLRGRVRDVSFFFLYRPGYRRTDPGEPCIPSEDPPGALEFRQRFTDSLVSDTRKPSQNSIVLDSQRISQDIPQRKKHR